jgi:ABC-2 type transport system ATP-binding protein
VALRAFPDKSVVQGRTGMLGAALAELAAGEHWRIEELHTEEGKLDEVFRSLTLSDTEQLRRAA